MQLLFPHMQLTALLLTFFLCDVVAGSIRRPRGLLREKMGDERNQKADISSDDTDKRKTNGHNFATAVHSPAVFGIDVDASVNLDDSFSPAASLDVFKNVRTKKIHTYDAVTDVFYLVATFHFIFKSNKTF